MTEPVQVDQAVAAQLMAAATDRAVAHRSRQQAAAAQRAAADDQLRADERSLQAQVTRQWEADRAATSQAAWELRPRQR